jgi:hypothetical protein
VHANGLQVRPVVTCRLDAPVAESVGDVRCGEADPGRKDGPASELIGGDICQPLIEVVGVDVGAIGRRRIGGIERADQHDGGGDDGEQAPTTGLAHW